MGTMALLCLYRCLQVRGQLLDQCFLLKDYGNFVRAVSILQVSEQLWDQLHLLKDFGNVVQALILMDPPIKVSYNVLPWGILLPGL